MNTPGTKTRLGAVVALGLALTAVGVGPQLQARLLGEEYVVRVAPVDPIDPFRGAYVDLQYPDLRVGAITDEGGLEGEGAVYITLVRKGDVWVAGEQSRTRPGHGPYLACEDRTWRLRCGIESWFLPQDKARALQDKVGREGARATLKVDARGHAALIAVE